MSPALRSFLRIDPAEANMVRRGFHVSSEFVRDRLERIGATFLQGYHAALDDVALDALALRLESIDTEFRGFGYEGAAMALDLLDQLTPWKPARTSGFLAGPAEPHTYMAIVGIGWSMARLSLGFGRRFSHLDPLLRWLVLDGWGFHEGYFHWPRYAGGRPHPRKLKGYARRAFDQGLGRSLWFVGGADAEVIVDLVEGFPDSRRGDLWSGIGLACTYAGGLDSLGICQLRRAAGSWWPHLAQGAAFAAKARARAGNLTEHTNEACRLLAGLPAIEAAALCDRMLSPAADGAEPEYESWRTRIQLYLSA
jgi:enediyne biosynthesis protein E3